MKRFEIDERFTEKVTEYIAKGYTINSHTMAGSQGEIGKIDLVKGTELIRIWLNSESDFSWDDDTSWSGNMLKLRVSRWNQEYTPEYQETVWMSHLTHIEEYTYYEVGRFCRNRWYVENLNEALACQKKHYSRYGNKRGYLNGTDIIDITSDATKEIAANYLKNHKDYQRVSRDRIKVLKRVCYNDGKKTSLEYIIKYNDSQVYRLK